MIQIQLLTTSERKDLRERGLKAYHKNWNKKYQEEHRAEVNARRRRNQLKAEFGITRDQYEALKTEQGDKCACCGTSEPGGVGEWHVDHNHQTKAVRGLLCSKCNIGIGLFGDSIGRLEKAVDYLKKHKGVV